MVAAIAAVAAVVVLGILLIMEKHNPAPSGGAEYATHLQLTNMRVSQAESLSGGRSTFVDGQILNNGDKTVTGATVEAEFDADGGQPQTVSAPLALIHMRDPYIDTRPLSAMPLAPGQQADFRIIFDGVAGSWNQRVPAIHFTQISTR